jgi:hypothetical protein
MATKKMQDGGPVDAMRKAMGQKKPSLKKTLKYVKKHGSGYIPSTGISKKMQDGGPTVSSKGAFYPNDKCRGEGCPKNPNDPKYKKEVAKLSPEQRKKIGSPSGADMKANGMAMKAKGMEMKAKGQELKRIGDAKKAKGEAMKADALSKKAAMRTTYTPGVRLGNDSVNSDGSITKSLQKGGSISDRGEKRRLKKSIKGMQKGYKPISGPSFKTGGMVNANASVKKQTVPGSRGVKSGVNPSATTSKVARGRVGGTSVAPKKAIPKAQYGMTMKKK